MRDQQTFNLKMLLSFACKCTILSVSVCIGLYPFVQLFISANICNIFRLSHFWHRCISSANNCSFNDIFIHSQVVSLYQKPLAQHHLPMFSDSGVLLPDARSLV